MRRVHLLMGDKSVVGGVPTEVLRGVINNRRELSFVGATVACPTCRSRRQVVVTGPRLPGDCSETRSNPGREWHPVAETGEQLAGVEKGLVGGFRHYS